MFARIEQQRKIIKNKAQDIVQLMENIANQTSNQGKKFI